VEGTGEVQPPGLEPVLQGCEEEPAEETRQDTDREAEPWSARDPPGEVPGKAGDLLHVRALGAQGQIAHLHVLEHALPKRGHRRLLWEHT